MLDAGIGKQRAGDFLRSLGAHVEDLGVSGQGETSLLEQSFHGTRITGSDAEFSTRGDGLEAGIAVCGHLAEIGNRFKAGFRGAELLQDVVFDTGGYDLGVGAAAVENGGWGTQNGRVGVETRQFERLVIKRNREGDQSNSWRPNSRLGRGLALNVEAHLTVKRGDGHAEHARGLFT